MYNIFNYSTIELYLSLWDDAAAIFKGILNSEVIVHSVMVVTTVNPTKIGGKLLIKFLKQIKQIANQVLSILQITFTSTPHQQLNFFSAPISHSSQSSLQGTIHFVIAVNIFNVWSIK